MILLITKQNNIGQVQAEARWTVFYTLNDIMELNSCIEPFQKNLLFNDILYPMCDLPPPGNWLNKILNKN